MGRPLLHTIPGMAAAAGAAVRRRAPSRGTRLPISLSLSLSAVGPYLCVTSGAAGRSSGGRGSASFAEFDRVLQDVQASASSLVQVDVPGDGNCLFSSIAVSHGFATSGAVPGAAAFTKRARKLRLQANDLLCPGKYASHPQHNFCTSTLQHSVIYR